MDLNYCTVCYRETNSSELYCSESCRLHDTPDDMRKHSNVVPATISPTRDSGFASAKRMGFRFRNYSCSSSDDEDAGSSEFVLPATRNVIYGNGAMAAQGTTGTRSQHFTNGVGKPSHAINNQPQKKRTGGGFMLQAAAMNGGGSNQEEFLDVEGAIFAQLSRPNSIEHRGKQQEKEQREVAKYFFKKEFPSAF